MLCAQVNKKSQPITILSHWNPDKKVWQSNFEQHNFWSTRATGWVTMNFVQQLKLIFSHHSSKYTIDIKDVDPSSSGYYLIHYGRSDQICENHGLGFITSDIVDRCNQGQLKLLIAFCYETFDGSVSFREWYNTFCGALLELGIKKSHSVVVLTNTITEWTPKYDNRCDILYYPWLEAFLKTELVKNSRTAPSIELIKKQKRFINLNLKPRPHRYLMLMYLIYKNIVDQGYVSWKNQDFQSWREILQNSNNCFAWYNNLSNFENDDFGFFHFVTSRKIINDMNLDKISGSEPWVGLDRHYQMACVDLVNETHAELYGDVFLSEKTFKPIAHGLPFIFNASRGHLAQVKKLGYESFPELFNEDYDDMPASVEKIVSIGDQLVEFCTTNAKIRLLETSPEILEKLKHNQDLFWNKNHAENLGSLLWKYWNEGRA